MKLKEELDYFADLYNCRDFIPEDSISVPHRFNRKQDIEISGLIAATLAWGRRKTIIKNANLFVALMGDSPYDFALNHREKDRKAFLDFKHRTFQPPDALAFLNFFQNYYRTHDSLEDLFASPISKEDTTVENSLIHFHRKFMELSEAAIRTRKHVASPESKSSCKRLNMFLRWMVRRDDKGVDFGIWRKISPSLLCIPFDVHVERIARKLQLVSRKQRDWKTTLELTARLREFDPKDPAKYDFALFGMSLAEKDILGGGK